MFRLIYSTWRRSLFLPCVLLPSRQPPILIHFTVTPRTAVGPPPHQDPNMAIPNCQICRSTGICIRTPSSNACTPHSVFSHPKHPLAPYSHLSRSDPPDPLDAHRCHPGTDRARTSRVGIHSEQPTVLAPRKTDDTRAH